MVWELKQSPIYQHQARIKPGASTVRPIYYSEAAATTPGAHRERGDSVGKQNPSRGEGASAGKAIDREGGEAAHLEAVDGEEAAEDALLEPRAEHDHVVLLIHGGGGGGALSASWSRWFRGARGGSTGGVSGEVMRRRRW